MRKLWVLQANCVVMLWFKEALAAIVREELARLPARRKREVALEAVVHFVVGALTSVLTWSFSEETACKPDVMEATFRALVTPGIEAAFGVARPHHAVPAPTTQKSKRSGGIS